MASNDTTRFLSMRQSVELSGLHPWTLRELCKDGSIEYWRTCNGSKFGHRKISRLSLLSYMGLDSEEEDNGNCLSVAYNRVSSVGQKAALATQVEQVVEEVKRREGKSPFVLSEICSSFCNRPQLNKLMAMVCEGKVKRVYVNYLDRLSRVPALTTMLKSLFERYGVELIVLNTECDEDPSSIQASMEELTHYVCIIANRAAGRKAGKMAKKSLSSDGIRRGTELILAGYPISSVASMLTQEGFVATNSKGTTRVSRHIVEQVILPTMEVSKEITKPRKIQNSLEEFYGAEVKVGGAKARLPKADLYRAYVLWVKSNREGEKPLSARRVGEILIHDYKLERKYTHSGNIAYCAIQLNGNGNGK